MERTKEQNEILNTKIHSVLLIGFGSLFVVVGVLLATGSIVANEPSINGVAIILIFAGVLMTLFGFRKREKLK